jgi:3'-5' exoribonuclease
MSSGTQIVRLCELEPEQTGDCFALLAAKDRATTRDGKPYFRTTFRDAARSVTLMVWSDSPWFNDCETKWKPGSFFKLRCRYSENQYGPQIELDRIREVEPGDEAEGFDPADFQESTRYDVDEMFDGLLGIANEQITDAPLKQLVAALLEEHAEEIKRIPAASRNHHAFSGGYLEHVLSVTRTALYLADKYAADYRHLEPPLSKSLVVAGAILHDIGKLIELDPQPQGAEYTPRGRLIGHILLGRDLVREKAAAISEMDPELLLRLEHIIVSHQNLPEWGSPIAPHTPEALLVYYADDIDAKFHMMALALAGESDEEEEFTSRHNPIRRPIFRGLR